jgi:muconolactone delta-isomerase
MQNDEKMVLDTDPEQRGLFDGPPPRARNADTDVERLRSRAKEPAARCERCGGMTKLYRRKLNSGMVRTLCWMVANYGREWIHTSKMPRFSAQSNEVSKLAFWGLVQQKVNTDSSKRTSGVWRTTVAGEEFAWSRTALPSHVFIESPGNTLAGFESTTTDIVEALGDHFDYPELMRGGGL